MSNPARAGGLEASDESSLLRDVVILRWPYCLRDLLERGLQDHTDRGFARHLAGFRMVNPNQPLVGSAFARDRRLGGAAVLD